MLLENVLAVLVRLMKKNFTGVNRRAYSLRLRNIVSIKL